MKILLRCCIPLSDEFSAALKNTPFGSLVLIRDGKNIPIFGMLQYGNDRIVYGADGYQYTLTSQDDLGVIE